MNYGGIAELNGVVGVCIATDDKLMFHTSKRLQYKTGDVINMGTRQLIIPFDTGGALSHGTWLFAGDVLVIDGPVYSIIKEHSPAQ
jgi:hypothetical protein